ncbi:hypothetical protein CLV42_10152 [Chitinophaga ginsengisoli]|uniref:Uncharacterized protein n=1 Tax=Chitinophaga ginsengisoli TaxID=363837 RepID=A0A2P8GMW5_9BACT|nr:hypothetical protein CLV42_10152 [Chitinophaga ginsengisoli]
MVNGIIRANRSAGGAAILFVARGATLGQRNGTPPECKTGVSQL